MPLHKGLILEVLSAPSAATYLALMNAVIEHPEFRIRSDAVRTLWQRFDAGERAPVSEAASALVPLWAHSPDFHILLFMLAKAQGDARSTEMEARFANACYHGMLETGDGSLERPYQVARVEDEYDLLRHLKIKPIRQTSMIRDDERVIDAFERTEGPKLHFVLPKADLLSGKLIP